MTRPPHTLPYRPSASEDEPGDLFPALKHPTKVGSFIPSGKVAPVFYLHVNGIKVRDARKHMRKFHSRESAEMAAREHDAERLKRTRKGGPGR